MGFIKDTAKGLFGGGGSGALRALFDPGDLLGTKGAEEAERAAQEQQDAFGRGIDVQSEQFQQILGLLGPSIEAGDSARQQQMALLGLLGPEAQQAAQAQFQQSPGQQFIRERQERALTRNQAAMGGLGGGNIKTALQQQAAGFASQDFNNQFNRLGGLSGAGNNAVSNAGQFGQQSAGNISNLLGQQGNAAASGILGAQQAQSQGVGNVLGLVGSFFSDSKLKDNITKIGKIGVLNVYEWTWKTTGLDDVGFIAQEVQEHFPDIVEEHNGFLRVDYNKAIERAA